MTVRQLYRMFIVAGVICLALGVVTFVLYRSSVSIVALGPTVVFVATAVFIKRAVMAVGDDW